MRPCFYCWWHFGNRRWMRTLPLGPPCSTSRKIVLFVPRPWYRRCLRHNRQATPWHALLAWSRKTSPPFLLLRTWWAHNPQFPGSKPDSPVHLVSKITPRAWLRMQFTSHIPSDLFGYQRQYLFTFPWNPFTFWLGIERFPGCLKLLIVPPNFTLDVF